MMKNKIYVIVFFVVTSIIFISCEFDREFITTLSEEQVTESYTYTKNRATAVYANLQSGFLYVDGAMMASATDEAIHTLETSDVHKYRSGSWNAYNNPDDVWSEYYRGIYKANLFLETSDSVNLDQYKLNPAEQLNYEIKLADIKRWKYEVRFLRAFYYFELVKRYGGVPLIKEAISLEDEFQNLTRNSLDDCVQFIVNECDSAATNLPQTYSSTDLGRITKGAALALKSRMLLYAASDLFNTSDWSGNYSNNELIQLSGDRQAKWKAAADAAKDLIDLNMYELQSSYSGLFGSSNFTSPEVILIRRNGNSNSFEKANYPIGYDYGNSGTTPTQNLVDAYEMTDGSAFDWDNPQHAANPYENRDPRLAFSVLLNNTSFKGRPVEAWVGGRDGKGIARATKTGYYLKKYVNESLDLITNRTSVHSWVFIRYAEIYLNYAEALNEYNPGHPDIKYYVDAVRSRESVQMPALPDGLSQDEMRNRIRNERRVELAFEDHRFWDLRRWMEAEDYLNTPVYGVKITKESDNTFDYERYLVSNQVFEPKMYLYPIPQNELNIAKGLVQNPLW